MPLVIVALVLVAWLLLAGLPFGRDKKEVVAKPATETIAEGTTTAPSAASGTIVEVGGDDTDSMEPPFATETAAPPPLATQTVPPVVTQTQPVQEPRQQPQPRQQPTPQPRQQPVPQPRQQPAPVIVDNRPAPRPSPPVTRPPVQQPRQTPAPQPAGEISEGEAAGVLRGHLASNNPYDVAGNCLQVRSGGYRNVGYGFSVWDTCVGGGGSRMLGRWRVDSKTREVFRQRDDGRYLRP